MSSLEGLHLTKSTYEMVCYEPGLKKQVIDLQSHLWSPSLVLNDEYFGWKYERNPYVESPLIYLAMHKDRAVGMRGFHGMQLEGGVPNQKAVALYADDLVIDPEHRNHGLIRRIMAAAFEDLAKRSYQYVLNLSAGHMNFLTSLTTGWRSVGSMQPMVHRSWRVVLRSAQDRLITRLPLPSRRTTEIAGQRPGKKRQSMANINAKRIKRIFAGIPWIHFEDKPRIAEMSELVERIGSTGQIRQVRDHQYFEWRFQNPLSRYRFLFWVKPRMEGYLVLQEYTSPYGNDEIVNIVDWGSD